MSILVFAFYITAHAGGVVVMNFIGFIQMISLKKLKKTLWITSPLLWINLHISLQNCCYVHFYIWTFYLHLNGSLVQKTLLFCDLFQVIGWIIHFVPWLLMLKRWICTWMIQVEAAGKSQLWRATNVLEPLFQLLFLNAVQKACNHYAVQ